MVTLADFYDQLDRHDWYYSYSDDHRVWQRGEAERKRLDELAATIPGAAELKAAFSKHYFTGEPWGNEKQPKPARPS